MGMRTVCCRAGALLREGAIVIGIGALFIAVAVLIITQGVVFLGLAIAVAFVAAITNRSDDIVAHSKGGQYAPLRNVAPTSSENMGLSTSKSSVSTTFRRTCGPWSRD